ncbi:MAG: hypothetical protein AYK23_01615 [Candidatus Proteinoplasmatales archaeon SG8-5]|nr:MAG: hypothetical protein AYK23_01615 [Candidatus Proteinoplasmatales archaeon SG8-5]
MVEEDRARSVMQRLFLFWFPILVSAFYIVLLWAVVPDPMFPVIGTLLLSYFISPFGKEVLIPTAVIALLTLHGPNQAALDILLVTSTVVFVDVMCSLFLLWNLDLLKHIPRIGRLIARVEKFGRARMRKSRRRRRHSFIALTSYMALPFQGSGGIVSTIVGMVIGMRKRRVWLAVWIGSIAGSLTIALVSFYAGQILIDVFGSFVWYLIGILVMAGIAAYIIVSYIRYRRTKALASA